ncbi:MAG: hypothetical protein QXM56_02110 [Acidilobaceae archaeon]
MGVLGCSVYYNEFLSSIVFTCSVSGRIESSSAITRLASESLELISKLLKTNFKSSGPESWEFVARRFNLFKFSANFEETTAGEIRVIEYCTSPLVVAGVLKGYRLEKLPEEVRKSLTEGETLETGEVLPLTLLERPIESGPFQEWVPKPAVYYVEGLPSQEVVESWKISIELRDFTFNVSLKELADLAQNSNIELHCVEGWSSRLSLYLVRLYDIVKRVQREDWLYAVSDKGYSAVAPASVLESGFIALAKVNARLTPPRLVLPDLFGWKWVKRVKLLAVLKRYTDGFWEARGYHERGLVLYDERFKIRNPEVVESGTMKCLSESPAPLTPRV